METFIMTGNANWLTGWTAGRRWLRSIAVGVGIAAIAGAEPSTGGANDASKIDPNAQSGAASGGATSLDPLAASAGSLSPDAGGLAPNQITEVFQVKPSSARPYVIVTFAYQFFAQYDGDYFVHCLRADQPDNTSGIEYKSLNAERKGLWITGKLEFQVPNDPALFGTYSFRIFGPVEIIGENPPPGGQRLDTIGPGKLHDVGRFTIGPYQTALAVPAEVRPHAKLTITWKDASVHPAAWLGLFKRDANNEHPLQRRSLVNLNKSWEVDAPDALGDYDVRAFVDAGWESTGVQGFAVTWGTNKAAVSTIASPCFPDAVISISFANAPSDINSWIGIFDETNSGNQTRWSWQDLQGKPSGEIVLNAPPLGGRYDVRLFDAHQNMVARSAVFQVVTGSPTVALSAKLDSGRVVLTWINPTDYQKLSGYYVYRGTAAGQESTTPLTAGPIPADTNAAAATRTNTYIDSNLPTGATYYYVVRPLQWDLKTFGKTSNEVSVTIPGTTGSGTSTKPTRILPEKPGPLPKGAPVRGRRS
jgi:hypothetical protein